MREARSGLNQAAWDDAQCVLWRLFFSFSPKQIKILRNNFENFSTQRKHVKVYAFVKNGLNLDGLVPNLMLPVSVSLLAFLKVKAHSYNFV